MTEWISVDASVREIAEEPWSLHWKEWKSDTDEFRSFLLDPLAVLSDQVKGVSDDFYVSTEILNHEISMRYSAVCTMAIVMPDERRVKLLLYKHRPD